MVNFISVLRMHVFAVVAINLLNKRESKRGEGGVGRRGCESAKGKQGDLPSTHYVAIFFSSDVSKDFSFLPRFGKLDDVVIARSRPIRPVFFAWLLFRTDFESARSGRSANLHFLHGVVAFSLNEMLKKDKEKHFCQVFLFPFRFSN